MSQTQPGETAPPPPSPILHNIALAGAIITPLAMLLPPRKMDVRFFVLAGTFSLASNQLVYDYSGQSIYSRFGNRASSVFATNLPEGARRTQQLLREQKARDEEAAQRRNKHDEAEGDRNQTAGLVKDIWMGGESEDWQDKRAEEHRKSIEEGKGLSGIIMDQIADVWSGNYGKRDAKSAAEDGDGSSTSERK